MMKLKINPPGVRTQFNPLPNGSWKLVNPVKTGQFTMGLRGFANTILKYVGFYLFNTVMTL